MIGQRERSAKPLPDIFPFESDSECSPANDSDGFGHDEEVLKEDKIDEDVPTENEGVNFSEEKGGENIPAENEGIDITHHSWTGKAEERESKRGRDSDKDAEREKGLDDYTFGESDDEYEEYESFLSAIATSPSVGDVANCKKKFRFNYFEHEFFEPHF